MFKKIILQSLLLIGVIATTQAQEVELLQPKLWFGVSGAANFNFYSGTTQTLNSQYKSQSAFHDGSGIAPFGSFLVEYRPTSVWGLTVNLGYDGRGGSFNGVVEPCDCPADLKTGLSYFVFEPSLRVAPFSNGFYLFLGGAYSYNFNKAFTFSQSPRVTSANDANQTITKGDFSEIRNSIFSGQVGMGYDIPLSSKSSTIQFDLSPFVSYHPYFGHQPRNIESWSLQTVRAGIALKIGHANAVKANVTSNTVDVIPPAAITEPSVKFNIQAPASIPAKRVIKEAFPIRNYVFFNENSSEIPNRYVLLNEKEAMDFSEKTFQEAEPKNVDGRSKRQLTAYYNILNILGDRMRKNPSTNVTLIGSSAGNGIPAGKEYAESIKNHLVNVFGINSSRITTEGRNQPIIASEQPGGTIDLGMLRDGDRRVDIVSNSSVILAPLEFTTVIDDTKEGRVVFTTETDKNIKIKSWSMDVIDEKQNIQHFGPYSDNEAIISGNEILGERAEGTYKVVMNAQTNDGKLIRKESTLRLVHDKAIVQNELRFSILFDFDKSKTVNTYEKFLTEVVAPQIQDNSTVIIHGHSDIIGDENYNLNLSEERARDAQNILEQALAKSGKKGIKFESKGYGDKTDFAPFNNNLPEERFYNRTVIIDIILAK